LHPDPHRFSPKALLRERERERERESERERERERERESLPKVFSRSEDLRESDGEVKDGQHHLDNTLATH